jgi:hypothetical protein
MKTLLLMLMVAGSVALFVEARPIQESAKPQVKDPALGLWAAHDLSGSNVVLGWSKAPGAAGYLIERRIFMTNSGYLNSQVLLSSNATFYVDINGEHQGDADMNYYSLAVQYPNGERSKTNFADLSLNDTCSPHNLLFGPPMAKDIYASLDSTGTNVAISWTSASGPAINYLILRGVYSPTNEDRYNFDALGTVSSNTTIYYVRGAIESSNDFNDVYEIAAIYRGNAFSSFVATAIYTNIDAPGSVNEPIPTN